MPFAAGSTEIWRECAAISAQAIPARAALAAARVLYSTLYFLPGTLAIGHDAAVGRVVRVPGCAGRGAASGPRCGPPAARQRACHRGRGDEDLSGFDFSPVDIMDEDDKPNKKHHTKSINRVKLETLTSTLDQAIPLLERDFKVKTQQLKVALANFRSHQKDMDVAKKEATAAMKALRAEAERRRRSAADRRLTKERERKAKEEAERTAKAAMIKKAQALMGVKGGAEDGILGDMSLGLMVDVLMALPEAVENPIFVKRLAKSKDIVVTNIQDFLNITRRKTAKFVLAASRASDVELAFLLARYFHEASFRVKAMQSDAQKVARDLNVVMPPKLRRSFLPIIKGLRANAVPLRVNATSLAGATIQTACLEISSLMGNISDYRRPN
ncbi:unnamed protein product [Prorocentrum cordatum]|uniref:Uncharacterized protein n=1 Tax=Prorocentrum cordatum TaxID=2364126 RepID=A0ABN9WBM6_9DINO|nr:unnamed protein product [Polarella glacialis]